MLLMAMSAGSGWIQQGQWRTVRRSGEPISILLPTPVIDKHLAREATYEHLGPCFNAWWQPQSGDVLNTVPEGHSLFVGCWCCWCTLLYVSTPAVLKPTCRSPTIHRNDRICIALQQVCEQTARCHLAHASRSDHDMSYTMLCSAS